MEMLTSLSVAELEALADGLLAPARQARLDQLLVKNAERSLGGEERRELDRLLELVDQLTLLKTRAIYPRPSQSGSDSLMSVRAGRAETARPRAVCQPDARIAGRLSISPRCGPRWRSIRRGPF